MAAMRIYASASSDPDQSCFQIYVMRGALYVEIVYRKVDNVKFHAFRIDIHCMSAIGQAPISDKTAGCSSDVDHLD